MNEDFEASFRNRVAMGGMPEQAGGGGRPRRKMSGGMIAIIILGVLTVGVMIAGIIIQNNVSNGSGDTVSPISELVGSWECDDGSEISFGEEVVTWKNGIIETQNDYAYLEGEIEFGGMAGRVIEDKIHLVNSAQQEIICQRSGE